MSGGDLPMWMPLLVLVFATFRLGWLMGSLHARNETRRMVNEPAEHDARPGLTSMW